MDLLFLCFINKGTGQEKPSPSSKKKKTKCNGTVQKYHKPDIQNNNINENQK
jgi:hypothetical protein